MIFSKIQSQKSKEPKSQKTIPEKVKIPKTQNSVRYEYFFTLLFQFLNLKEAITCNKKTLLLLFSTKTMAKDS